MSVSIWANRLALFAAFVVATASVYAEEAPGGFSAASDIAQARTAKILGGAIGRTPGYATGLIVSPRGEILTSQGSFLNVDNLRVILPDGGEHQARVVRRSNALQTALLKIEAETPQFFNLSEQANVESGDWILAVSNAFKVADGAEPLSVNVGVISLKTKLDARRGFSEFPYEGDVFLIDAITSNPGAAGGAVVDLRGRLVGMIGKVIEGKTTNTRLNYALPADQLADFVAGKEAAPMIVSSSQQKGDLGVRLFALGGRKAPAFIDRVLPGSPAAVAGVKSDDLVISLAGEAVANGGDFQRLSDDVKAGQEVVLEVKRKNMVLMFRLTPIVREGTP